MIKAVCPKLFCIFITTAWTSTSLYAIFFFPMTICLSVQMEVENHGVTIALMPVAESKDSILICTPVCRSIYPLHSLSRDGVE